MSRRRRLAAALAGLTLSLGGVAVTAAPAAAAPIMSGPTVHTNAVGTKAYVFRYFGEWHWYDPRNNQYSKHGYWLKSSAQRACDAHNIAYARNHGL